MRVLKKAYLDTGLGQVDLQGDFLAHEDVRVPGLGEEALEHVKLGPRERRPLAPLLARVTCIDNNTATARRHSLYTTP